MVMIARKLHKRNMAFAVWLLGFLNVLFLAACAVTPDPVPATPITAAQLESLLLAAGDLPAGMNGGQVREPPAMFADLPPVDVRVYQQLARGGEPAGGVAVFVYADQGQRAAAYAQLARELGEGAPVEGVGESARASGASGLVAFADLVFVRCQVVAHVRLMGEDLAAVTAYARRLDGRLQAAVCP